MGVFKSLKKRGFKTLKYYHLLWEMRFEVGHLKISRSLVRDKKEHSGQKEQHVQKPV